MAAMVGVVLWPARAAAGDPADPPSWDELMAVRSTGQTAVLKSPEALWAFLIAPDTPYMERWAAAAQGKDLLPPNYLPKLYVTMDQLRREESIHNWGLMANPRLATTINLRHLGLAEPVPVEPVRKVLGSTWKRPTEQGEYPQTHGDAAKAPWPWQVQRVLWWMQAWSIPRGTDGRDVEPWLEAAMTMPIDTDQQAELFVEATRGITHRKSIPVMARWRTILNDPKKPNAAMAVAGAIGHQAISLWQAADARDIGQVIFLDGLKSQRRELRTQMAYALRSISETWDPKTRTNRTTLLATSVLAMAERAVGGDEDHWTRLYCYAFTVCESVDTPPFKPDRRLDPKSPEVAKQLDVFARWYAEHKKELQALAAKEEPALDAARERLDKAAAAASAP